MLGGVYNDSEPNAAFGFEPPNGEKTFFFGASVVPSTASEEDEKAFPPVESLRGEVPGGVYNELEPGVAFGFASSNEDEALFADP